MRKTVLWQHPHVRATLAALLAFAAMAIIAGCGGGGGGSNNNGGNNTNGGNVQPIGVTGRVVDSSNTANGVPGARITLHGAGVSDISTTTAADGSFFIANVPSTYTSFSVTSPDPVRWYNFANYGGKNYDTVNCRLPLPGIASASNNNIGTIILSSGGTNPPPPPPIGGCP